MTGSLLRRHRLDDRHCRVPAGELKLADCECRHGREHGYDREDLPVPRQRREVIAKVIAVARLGAAAPPRPLMKPGSAAKNGD